jgi:hypothetical protein
VSTPLEHGASSRESGVFVASRSSPAHAPRGGSGHLARHGGQAARLQCGAPARHSCIDRRGCVEVGKSGPSRVTASCAPRASRGRRGRARLSVRVRVRTQRVNRVALRFDVRDDARQRQPGAGPRFRLPTTAMKYERYDSRALELERAGREEEASRAVGRPRRGAPSTTQSEVNRPNCGRTRAAYANAHAPNSEPWRAANVNGRTGVTSKEGRARRLPLARGPVF